MRVESILMPKSFIIVRLFGILAEVTGVITMTQSPTSVRCLLVDKSRLLMLVPARARSPID